MLLEQGRLTSGTTWHAAGLVGQLRAHESMTRLIRYSTELYSKLEAETGLGTGWKQCGSLAVARTADRMIQLKRTAAVARAHGVDCDVISVAEAGERYPLMATADLKGGVWLPGDGKANPTDLTLALAKGARNRGVRICEGRACQRRGYARGLDRRISRNSSETVEDRPPADRTAVDIVVLCGGQWSRALGRRLGVTVPLFPREHYYIVTDVIPGVHRDLPVLRDPDGYIYFKEEVGGLLMGGFEPQATPWLQSAEHRGGIPENFEFQLLRDNWDAFQDPARQRDDPCAGARGRAAQAVLQRPRVIHCGQQLHPRSGAGRRQPLCRLRLQFDGNCVRRWRRQGARRMDHRRPSRRSIFGQSHPPFCAASTATKAGCPIGSPRCLACTTRCRGQTVNSRAHGRFAARRCTRNCSHAWSLLRFKDGLGARQFFRAFSRASAHRVRLGSPELAPAGSRPNTGPAAKRLRCST